MGLFDKMENRIESVINGVFSRAFKSDVDPREIGVALQKQLDSASRSMDQDRRLVPNDFRVSLARHDYDRLAPFSHNLNAEFIPGLREYAASRHYVFSGAIAIAYQLDETLPTGRFVITSSNQAGVVSDSELGMDDTMTGQGLVLEVNKVRHPLVPPGFTIGRGTEADLRINDPGISRLHAKISVENTDDGELLITISDLHSTNGIVVNGEKTNSAELKDGTRIEIGSTRMLVHSPLGV